MVGNVVDHAKVVKNNKTRATKEEWLVINRHLPILQQ
jgi:hypothetical protein